MSAPGQIEDPMTPGEDVANPPALSARGVGKTFPGSRALIGLDLDIAPGEIRALLGANGSGKSTFIKILSGFHRPDPGAEVEIGGAALEFGDPSACHVLGGRFVHQDLALINDSSILDNLSFGEGFPTRMGSILSRSARQAASESLDQVGLDLDPLTLVRDLAPAEKTGVAVARALRETRETPVRLLVLDEPTATLPAPEVRRLLDIVRRVAARGVGVLYVTHRLDEVFQVARTATVLRNGREVITAAVAGLTRGQLVHYLVGSELDEAHREAAALADEADAANTVLSIRDLRAGSLHGVSLEIAAGSVVGVSGVTGSGREFLLPAIFGAAKREGGEVSVDGSTLAPFRPSEAIRRGAIFLPADRKLLGGLMDMTARENLTLSSIAEFWKFPMIRRKTERTDVRQWFDRLQIQPPQGLEQTLLTFSGGNQQKVLFAKWLRLNPKLLLLDEPTQGVDVGAKAEIHHQILTAAAAGAAVLVCSSDIDELVALCSRIVVVRDGHIAADMTGADITVAKVSAETITSQAEHALT